MADSTNGFHTSIMVALYVPEGARAQLIEYQSTLPEGSDLTPSDEFHITLGYFGKVDEVRFSESDILGALAELSSQLTSVRARVGGVGRFSKESDGKQAVWAQVDSPQIINMQDKVLEHLRRRGISASREHGFTPHITLGYVPAEMPASMLAPPEIEIGFGSIYLSHGDNVTRLPLQGETIVAELTEGNALKALSVTDTEFRVGNYMALFGGRDLEGIASPRVNADGSFGEYFTKATKFDSPYTELDMVAIDWEHGVAPQDEPGRDDLLGRVDWKTAKIDDKGLFVERVLNRRNQYVQFLEELIKLGLIGTSSEPIQNGAKSAKNGEITEWPLMRDTLTVTPMEPRMMSENTLTAFKALSQRIPALKSYIGNAGEDAKTDRPEADRTSADPVANKSDVAKRLSIEVELLELSL